MTDTSKDLGSLTEPIKRLTRDLRQASRLLSVAEARYLVDAYYQMQRDRIRAAHQRRTLALAEEPNEVVDWLEANTGVLERNIKSALGAFRQASPVGRWAESICGVGPVISAGLLAQINIEKAPTVGHIWRFAGLDPTVVWAKGQKRPWNGALKRLCWIIGESFVKVQAHDEDVYGKLYAARKVIEEAKNAAGAFREQAERSLATKRWRDETTTRAAYEAGRLPQARLHLRAERWAVKIFLSHWQHVAYFHRFRVHPPKPYVLAQLGHAHEIQVPHWPF